MFLLCSFLRLLALAERFLLAAAHRWLGSMLLLESGVARAAVLAAAAAAAALAHDFVVVVAVVVLNEATVMVLTSVTTALRTFMDTWTTDGEEKASWCLLDGRCVMHCDGSHLCLKVASGPSQRHSTSVVCRYRVL